MIISIHIPKTAGTTLANYFDHSFSRHVYFDYYQHIPRDEDRAQVILHKDFLRRFKMIHGHFHYKKYEGIFDDASYITCVRHPVDRMISNYRHILRIKDETKPSYQFMKQNGFDVVTFASFPSMTRAMAIYLEGKPINEYDFIGLSEELGVTIEMLEVFLNTKLRLPEAYDRSEVENMINMNYFQRIAYRYASGRLTVNKSGKVEPVRFINVNPDGKTDRDKITTAERQKLESLLAEEMDVYHQAVGRFNDLKKKLLT